MSTMQTLLDDLNDRLNDANNAAGAGEAAKIRWINNGVRAMWPRIFKVASGTITIAADTYSYSLPAGLDDDCFIYKVEVEVDESDGRYVGFNGQYKLPEMHDDRVIEIHNPNEYEGHKVRLRAVSRIPDMATTGTTFEGPPGTEELPVLYALGIASSRRLEDRLLHTRFSTTAAQNGVGTNDIMNAHQFWFAQFELLCDRYAMPWPASSEN